MHIYSTGWEREKTLGWQGIQKPQQHGSEKERVEEEAAITKKQWECLLKSRHVLNKVVTEGGGAPGDVWEKRKEDKSLSSKIGTDASLKWRIILENYKLTPIGIATRGRERTVREGGLGKPLTETGGGSATSVHVTRGEKVLGS